MKRTSYGLSLLFVCGMCCSCRDIPPEGYDVLPTPIWLVDSPTSQLVKGRVLDEAGNPIAGAVVLVYPGKSGVVSDSLGRFQLIAPLSVETLCVSREGFKTRVVPLKKMAAK